MIFAAADEARYSELTMVNGPVEGKRVTVLGAARSGIAVARLLKNNGARVYVSDAAPSDRLRPQIEALQSEQIEFETGRHSDRVYDADLLVLSPGVPTDSTVVRQALRRGIRIVSELEAASWFSRAPIVAVTGTNGKTTTTTLIGRIFSDARRDHVVAGNIGTAFSGVADELGADSVAVLEVSSFQLDYTESFHPKVSIILNITPDHLDRYNHDFSLYIASKCRVFQQQTEEDVLIYNDDDDVIREQLRNRAGLRPRLLPFARERRLEEGAFLDNGILVTVLGARKSEIIPAAEISIRGLHNLANAMAAALAGQVLGVPVSSIRATLRNFKGVEHRLEFVRELGGVSYVNDSKATNVDSVWYALQSFAEPIVLLLGGRDKGNDYARLRDLIRSHVRAIVAIGESAGKVMESFEDLCPVVRAMSMDEAVQKARELAKRGDAVLLSPACASFDWFENYEHRGRVFKEIVNSLDVQNDA